MLLFFQPASAMGMPMPVTSTLMCGRPQGIALVVSAMTVSTTRKVRIASDVSQASIGISGDPSLLQMLAKVSKLMLPGRKEDLYKRGESFHPPFPGPRERGSEISDDKSHTSVNFFTDNRQEFSAC